MEDDMAPTAIRTALVIGATGGLGSETARALVAHGWRVRALSRDPARAASRFAWAGALIWVPGDAMDAAAMVSAARGQQRRDDAALRGAGLGAVDAPLLRYARP